MAGMVHWGILATGGIARKFAAQLPESRTGRLVAVASRTREGAKRFAAEFGGVRAHSGYEALLADPGVQAVYVATPHPVHREWVVRAAAAGKHILCEKPLALNRAQAAEMIAAARQHRVFLMEAFMYRCHPQTDALVRLLQDGTLGKLTHIEACFRLDRTFDPAHRLFDRRLGGGAILDLGCYPVSFARRMAGAALGRTVAEPAEFAGAGRLHPATRTDEFATAHVRFPGGITAALTCGTIGPQEVFARLEGTRGRVDLPAPFAPGYGGLPEWFLLTRSGAREGRKIHCRGEVGIYAHEADAVGAALARGDREAPQMPWADTLANLAVLDAWRAAVGVEYPGE